MANKFVGTGDVLMPKGGGRPPTGVRGPKEKSFSPDPEKTAAWPGLPGKAQPGTRDKSGTKKLKTHAKSEGI